MNQSGIRQVAKSPSKYEIYTNSYQEIVDENLGEEFRSYNRN